MPDKRGLQSSSMIVYFFVVSLLLTAFNAKMAVAQKVANAPATTIEDLLHEMDALKDEVRYLRERDADRQNWESSLAEQPSIAVVPLVSEMSWSFEESNQGNSSCDTCAGACCTEQSCRCNGCRCYPCQCPLPEAPCIECSHVSTLTPHYNINIFGAMVGDMLFNEARPISPGAPYYLSPASPTGLDQNTVDVHGRSSYLGAALTGPQMGNFQAGGMAMVFFYNDNVLADQYGILPAQVFGDLKNEDWRIAVGLQFDVFNPGAPTMLAYSALCGSGNAGNAWRGQFRIERFLNPSKDRQWTLQAALSEPIASSITSDFGILGEDNGWPNIEGRIALGLGPLDAIKAIRPMEIGLSGVVGEIRTTPFAGTRVVTDVWGVAVDYRWQMTERFGVTGEAYTGKTLGTYNGGILQNLNATTFDGINSSGGWGEVFLYWTPCLHSHVGYGIDDPDDGDLSADPTKAQRERNETFFANLIWDLNQSFRIGFETTYRETDNTSVLDNEGAGFHTQFQWAF